jgi:hypothetical protein
MYSLKTETDDEFTAMLYALCIFGELNTDGDPCIHFRLYTSRLTVYGCNLYHAFYVSEVTETDNGHGHVFLING